MLDAVIVWDVIARYYSDYGTEVPILVEKYHFGFPQGGVPSTIGIGVLKFTQNRDPAEKFVEFAASGQGQHIFKKHNYRTEPPNRVEFSDIHT